MSRTWTVVVVLFACAAIACAGHSPCRAQVEAVFGGEDGREAEARPLRSVIVLVLPASMWTGDGSPIGPQGGSPIDALASVMLDGTPYPMPTSLPPLPKDGSVALGVVVYGGPEHKNATGDVGDHSRVGTPGSQVASFGHLRWPMSEELARAAWPGSRGVHEGMARGDVILTSRVVTYVPSPAGGAVLSPAEAMLRAGELIEGFADSERARLGSFAARRHVLVVLADEPSGHQWRENDRGGHDWAALASARDRLVGRCAPGERPARECSLADQVSAIGLGMYGSGVARDLLFDHVADSVEQFGPIAGEKNLGIAASVDLPDAMLQDHKNRAVPRFPAREIPITTIDSALTARLVAKRVKAVPRMTKSNESKLDSPMRLAAAYFEGTGPSNWAFKYPDHADYRSVLFLTEKFNQISGSFPPHLTPGSLSVLVNDVTAPGGAFLGLPVTVHQSNAIGLDSVSPGEVFSRDAAKIHMENANWRFPMPIDNEDNLGIVAEAVDLAGFAWTSPQYLDVLHRMISRLTVCPSDYNRDGVSNSANPGADWTPFIDHYTNAGTTTPAQHDYADWNFDTFHYSNTSPQSPAPGVENDAAKFLNGFSAGCNDNP